MYQASEAFNDSISGNSRTFYPRMEISGKDIKAEITSIVYAAAANPGDYVTVGGAVSAGVQITMKKPDAVMENAEFALYIGLNVNGAAEYVPLGLFTVQKPQNDDGMLSFTAYDRMTSKLSGAYFSELTYPVDGKAVLREISQMTGVPLSGLQTLPDGIMVDRRAVIAESGADDSGEKTTTTTYSNPFDGYTYREALGYVAQLYVKFAAINRAGEIELRWYKDVDYTISASKYYDDLVTTEQNFALGSIECTTGDKTLVSGTGTAGMQITSPVMTQEHLDRIYAGLKEFSFLPASLSFFGDIRLDTGDIVKVQDKYGTIIKIPVMNITQDFDGGLMTAIASQGKTEAESSSGAAKGPTAQALDRVYTDLFLVKEILGNKANFDYVHAAKAELDAALVKKLDAETADIKYAKIDFTNIDSAAMEYFYARSGLIKDVTIGDATITGHLVGVTISGDLIEGNTIKAEKLVIKGEDGLYYKLNVNAEGTSTKQTDYNSLNGSILQAKSVTAEKISVKDLVAFGATIGGFKIGDHSLYSQGKTTVDSTVHGVYMDDDGQIAFGDAANYIKYYKDTDGKYKLSISVDELTIGSGTSVGEELDSIKDDICNVRDEIITTLRIESSAGSSLTAGAGLPVLSVIIYHGRTRITDSDALVKTMGSEVYLEWSRKKKSESAYTTISSNDSRISKNGFLFSPSKADVESHSTFKCCLLSKGDGYVDPDQQTVLDRLESRLTDYVDDTLFPSVKEEFETVKTEVIRELSSDTYIAQIEKNTSDISELKQQISGSKPMDQGISLAWLGWSNNIERGNGIENDAIMFSKHDIVGMQRLNLNRLADSRPIFTENTVKILKRAKELNPKLRTFEYLQSESGRVDFTYNGDHAHLNSDGSWEGSTADLSGCTRIYTCQQICDWLDYFKETGTDGVFFDDWGYDFTKEDICYQMGLSADDYADKNAALNQKWIMLIEACHDRGLFLITNGGMPFSVGDWYTYLDENDIICLESCLISSTNYKDDYAWQNGQKNIYDYYANWYSNGKCKAKLWSMNYFQSDADGVYREQVLTYLCAITLACGGHYVSMGAFRCIEKPEFVQLFADGDTKTVKKIDDNTYQLKVNNHVLEVHKWSNLSGNVSEETASKNYYILDGRKFTNGFLTAPVVDGELAGEIEEISKKLDSMGDDSRKNAISYWRMAIDDWNASLTFSDYVNMILTDPEIHGISGGSLEIVRNSDGTCDIVCSYTELSQGGIYLSVIRPSNYESFEQTGEGLEFGFSDVIFNMSEDSWTLPNGTVYEAKWLWSTPSFYVYIDRTPLDGTSVTDYKIDGTGSDLGMSTGHYKKTSQDVFTSFNIRVWFHAPDGQYFNGTVTLKNVYLIDLGEHSDEVSKKWYTNIFPTNFNNSSAMAAGMAAGEKQGWKVYDFSVSHTNAWGWTKYKYTGDELIAMRGHTIELGCTSMAFSNGQTGVGSSANGWVNYAFGIGVNTDNPNTVRLYADTVAKSEVWGEKLCCLKYTIPDDATSLVVGFQSYGFPTDVTLTVKDVYMYDLGEEVSIRGKSSTNASLRLCRINEAQEALTPSNMRNALYVTEKGRMYCCDLTGVKTDIAGSVYVGAVEAGYTGSPEEFGRDLYGLLQAGTGVVYCSGISINSGDMDLLVSDTEPRKLSVTITPANCTQAVSWTSSNEDAATISQEGILTVVGAGETIITAACGNYSDSITVTVDDPNVSVNIAKGGSWVNSGGKTTLSNNSARAFSYCGDSIPGYTADPTHVYGIPLVKGRSYRITLDGDACNGCYYGIQVWSESSVILNPGWQTAGTETTYTAEADSLYLNINFKYGSAGSATITDEILAKLQNGFSVTKIYD